MDSSNFPMADGKRPSPKNQLQIQGPRPPPLSINNVSRKIKKPPKPPLPQEQSHHQGQQPVIIYAVSPKIINVTAADFMTTVQRLTGVSSGEGDVSPAARMAAVEKVMNSQKEKGSSATVMNDGMVVEEGEGEGEGFEVGRVPGILSPAALPPVAQEMYFSPGPVADPFGSSVMHGNYGFLTSPSGLFSSFVGSPVLSPDIFGQIWNFS